MAGKAEEAEQVLTQSLKDYPNNGWALYGLMHAQRALGKEAAAKETEQRFQKAWTGDLQALDLKHL
jgi:hypothetical protein